MSNKGARAFFLVTDTIKDTLLADVDVNTVTYGDLTEINLNKQDIFPLAHTIINTVTHNDNTLTFNVSILFMDVINSNKLPERDRFIGNDNEHYTLNTMLAVANRFIGKFRGGTLYQNQYQVEADPTLEPFYDRFENKLVGWAMTMDIIVNNDIYKC
jgi:hypothetical protein